MQLSHGAPDMTISDNSRTAGPFFCNGVTKDFPFSYKVFSRSDLVVAITDTATNVESLLTLDADYTVSLNGNQNANPGGTIHTLTAYPPGKTLAATSAIAYTQPLELTNQGGFYPRTINDALDRIVIMIQQVGARAGLGLNIGSAALVALLSLLPTPTGSSTIGYLQNGIGAIARKVQDHLREKVSVLDFGADPTGVTDSTDAFKRTQTYLASKGGGRARVPIGKYMLTNFVIDQESVVFEGETSGYGYTTTTGSVQLIPSPTAIFAVRLKGTRTGVVINASAYSGLRNLQVTYAPGAAEYGVFIDSGATIMEKVIVQGFPYNCMCADQMNANLFRHCTFVAATKVNFGVCEVAANSYINPAIAGITSVSNTTWTMEGCLFRQSQGFGVVLRSGVNVTFRGCGFESNKQAGMYIYRPNSSTVRMIQLDTCWFENNYEDYTTGSLTYSVAGNRMFLIGDAATYIAWTSAYQAGYQLVSDSQTHYGGGGDTFDFRECSFVAAGAAQKAIMILSGFKYDFRKCWFGGTGDIANLVKVTVDAEAVHWYDPVAGNNPYALVTSITDNFGANSGTRGAYYKSGTSFGTKELGGQYPILGITGGPIHFLPPVANDPRSADQRCLDDYNELNTADFAISWRTASAVPFTINSQTNRATKIGREVKIKCQGTITVSSATATPDRFFCNALLPFQAAEAGNVVGTVVIKATGGGAAVVNNGVSPLEMNAVASLLSVLDVFPALALGMTFSYQVDVSYPTAT
jgi:hypothetical protein